MTEEFYRVLRSNRRTIAVQILDDGSIVVRCPRYMEDARIKAFVESKRKWIEKHLASCEREALPAFSASDIDQMTGLAKTVIPPRVESLACQMGLRYQKITIRHQHSRWGSCSSKGNLSFNCLLTQVPDSVLEYVVVHELCHLKQMNHSRAFWTEVGRILPEYKQAKQWLKEHGGTLIRRLPRPTGGTDYE